MKKLLFLFAFLLIGVTAAEAQLISYSQTTRTKEKKKLKPIEPGYQQTVALPVYIGGWGEGLFAGVVYEGGYRFNNTFYLGFGAGAEYVFIEPNHINYFSSDFGYSGGHCGMGDASFPIYAVMRVYFLKKNFQPYLSLAAGGKIGTGDDFWVHTPFKGFSKRYSTSSYLFEPALGFDWRLTDKIALNFHLMVSLQCAPYFEGDIDSGTIMRELYIPTGARIGITF